MCAVPVEWYTLKGTKVGGEPWPFAPEATGVSGPIGLLFDTPIWLLLTTPAFMMVVAATNLLKFGPVLRTSAAPFAAVKTSV